jgi:hypothetical protein
VFLWDKAIGIKRSLVSWICLGEDKEEKVAVIAVSF